MNASFAHSARRARFSRSATRAERIARIDRLASLLDTRFVIPFTKFRFGADSLIGLAPGLGDVVTTALSLYIVYEAHKLGAPKTVLARMLGNVAIDGMVGAVPVAGDVFDVMFRANRRNVRILREHLDRAGR
ncbi:DUF4112 domain-containing protein [Pseudorhodoplanes sp.]|uniref:DUF4112 domain-containing protein n=1 Tax=Pseudorhodoplanes sp. TaxID=1934341 RepID=UPI003D14EE71